MDLTVLQQGRFTSTGTAKTLQIRSDLDWMWVYNYKQAGLSPNPGVGVQFYWQRGMSPDTGIEYKKTNSSNALNMVTLTSGGFTLVDSSVNIPETNLTGTTITKAAPAVASVATNPYLTGDIVRIYSSDTMNQINGLDFTIGSAGNGSTFTLANLNTNVTNFTAASSFVARRIPYNPLFYPRNRVITNISKATQAIVTMAVTHGFTVGQQVRLIVPSQFGMTSLDGVIGTVMAVGAADADGFTNTITIDVDTSGFTAFGWPVSDAAPLTWAQVVPVGEADFTTSLIDPNRLDDATVNTGYIGIKLAAGVDSPAGSNDDVIYWTAGRSFSVDNQ